MGFHRQPCGDRNGPGDLRRLAVAVPIIVWFAPLDIDPTARHALAISLFVIVGWIVEVLPHAVTGLIGCFLFWATNVARIDTAFAGFVDPTTWFYLGVLLFGLMT